MDKNETLLYLRSINAPKTTLACLLELRFEYETTIRKIDSDLEHGIFVANLEHGIFVANPFEILSAKRIVLKDLEELNFAIKEVADERQRNR